MTQEEKQMSNHEIDIPEFLKGEIKDIVTMPEPDFKQLMYRVRKDGIKDGTTIGTVRGFILGALITVLVYAVYATCFATHMLPMAGP